MFPKLISRRIESSEVVQNGAQEYAKLLKQLNFQGAIKLIDSCIEAVENEKAQKKSGFDEQVLNQLYIIGQFLKMLGEYSKFWEQVKSHHFSKSWDSLQNTQDRLRFLKRFCADYNQLGLATLERQVITIEKLYPYKIFASSELVVGDVKCSICGKNIDSLKCSHIAGELYNGEMAYGIVGKIEAVNGVALVEHPLDKRCVIQIEDTDTKFSGVAYLSELINKSKVSPWNIAGVNETTRSKSIDEYSEYPLNESCPCGSKKEFSACCSSKKHVLVPHMEILVCLEWGLNI
jgi:hypothetical protein